MLDAHVRRTAVSFGHRHAVSVRLADGATPLAGQPVTLEGHLYPYERPFAVLASTTTAADGTAAFRVRLRRNARLRVTAPAQQLASPVLRTYTFPAVALRFRTRATGGVRRVRLTQRYRVPRGALLTARTRFYLGPRRAGRSVVRRLAPTVRVRPGRFRSRVTVALPKAWGRRFRFASCFPTSPGSGLGRPGARCPRRFSFQRAAAASFAASMSASSTMTFACL